jgi:hypothetical protein
MDILSITLAVIQTIFSVLSFFDQKKSNRTSTQINLNIQNNQASAGSASNYIGEKLKSGLQIPGWATGLFVVIFVIPIFIYLPKYKIRIILFVLLINLAIVLMRFIFIKHSGNLLIKAGIPISFTVNTWLLFMAKVNLIKFGTSIVLTQGYPLFVNLLSLTLLPLLISFQIVAAVMVLANIICSLQYAKKYSINMDFAVAKNDWVKIPVIVLFIAEAALVLLNFIFLR